MNKLSRNIALLSIFVGLLLAPQMAWAGTKNWPWYTTLLVVSTVSTLISVVLVWRNSKLTSFTERAMAFGAWFWLIIFIQVMLYGFWIAITR